MDLKELTRITKGLDNVRERLHRKDEIFDALLRVGDVSHISGWLCGHSVQGSELLQMINRDRYDLAYHVTQNQLFTQLGEPEDPESSELLEYCIQRNMEGIHDCTRIWILQNIARQLCIIEPFFEHFTFRSVIEGYLTYASC